MKTRTQMLADAIALVEQVDSEYYREDVKSIERSIESVPHDVVVTDVRHGQRSSERVVTLKERQDNLGAAVAKQVPVLRALSYLQDALVESTVRKTKQNDA